MNGTKRIMNGTKRIMTIRIWEKELDKYDDHKCSYRDEHEIYVNTLKAKGKLLPFKTTNGEIMAYNIDTIFKYKIEPVE